VAFSPSSDGDRTNAVSVVDWVNQSTLFKRHVMVAHHKREERQWSGKMEAGRRESDDLIRKEGVHLSPFSIILFIKFVVVLIVVTVLARGSIGGRGGTASTSKFLIGEGMRTGGDRVLIGEETCHKNEGVCDW
jgi:hypothetical protein